MSFVFPTFNRILNDAVYNFPNNQEEITLVVCPETFKVKNYVDDEPGEWKIQHPVQQHNNKYLLCAVDIILWFKFFLGLKFVKPFSFDFSLSNIHDCNLKQVKQQNLIIV